VKSKATTRSNISARGKGPKKSKMGLGAVKLQKVDIEEAEQKAKEEELINSLARSEEEMDSGSQRKSEDQRSFSSRLMYNDGTQSTSGSGLDIDKRKSEDIERLGMGFSRLGFGTIPSNLKPSSTKTEESTNSRYVGFGSTNSNNSGQQAQNGK